MHSHLGAEAMAVASIHDVDSKHSDVPGGYLVSQWGYTVSQV